MVLGAFSLLHNAIASINDNDITDFIIYYYTFSFDFWLPTFNFQVQLFFFFEEKRHHKKTLTLSRRRFLPPATPPSSQTIAVYSLHNYNNKMCHDRLAVLPTTPDCSVHATHRLSSRIQLHARVRPPRQQRFSPSWVKRETSRNAPATSSCTASRRVRERQIARKS